MDLGGLTPADIGLPSKFEFWRPGQEDAISRILDARKRFTVICAPVGFGKSPAYVGAALSSDLRCPVLTVTKPLQDQLMKDFSACGMVDIRGRANYDCVLGADLSCDDGIELRCKPKDERGHDCCRYKLALEQARMANLFVTNYAYWCHIQKGQEGLGDFDRLILDEAHDAVDTVCSIKSVFLHERDIRLRLRQSFPNTTEDIEAWRRWAVLMVRPATDLRDRLMQQRDSGDTSRALARDLRGMRTLLTHLDGVIHMRGRWVVERQRSGYTLEPVWASDYAEEVLFLNAKKIVLTSATITPHVMRLLGVPEEETEFVEYTSSFPAHRSPVYYIPTVKLSHKTKDEGIAKWLSRIDEIISARLDRKGIIHVGSYERARLVMATSEYSRHMMSHDPGGIAASSAVESFRYARPPAILVSPALTTGYDFPGDDCRYQIIAKVPFPDTRTAVMRARTGRDAPEGSPERAAGELYTMWTIAKEIAQATGRSTRSAEDWSEVFIIDNQWPWVYSRHLDLYPNDFRKKVRNIREERDGGVRLPVPLRGNN